MEIRFYEDTETGLPHIYQHGITEAEVWQVLHGRGEDFPARDNSRMRVGQTAAGRYLQVIYVPDEDPKSVFVITAYEVRGKAKTAFRRRQRKTTMNEQKFPPGWNEERVRQVIAHYEDETEDEQFAEIEAAREAEGVTIMAVPTELVPDVQALILRNRNG
jgi:hypothetical protein